MNEIDVVSDGVAYLSLLVELVKAIVWPVSIFSAMYIFREQLKPLLSKVRRAGPTGLEFAIEDQKTKVETSRPLSPEQLKQLKGMERTPAIAGFEVKLHDVYNQIEEEDRLDTAIRELAQARLDVHFAIVYTSIFGSQIKFLKLLRERGGSVNDDFAREYFSDIQKSYEILSDWDYTRYYRYLVANGLLGVIDVDFNLLPLGNDFLLFLYRFGLSEDRAL